MSNSSDSNQKEAVTPSDRDLLRRFIFDGDEASFAAIVDRHAALVMSVCRRVLGHSPDVDDAFQATFFALSQRPAGIYECLSLAGWLYGVAWRISGRLVRLRKRTMMQALPEQIPARGPDPLDAIAEASDLASLDDALNRLPQKFRDVLVMSYFTQQTNQEIADQLNESKGAIDGRIRDARRMLRVRLARRGVEVSVLTLATAYLQSSASAASPALIRMAISLGAPGLYSQELVSLDAAQVAQMNLLASTGVSLMSKIGLTITAGMVLAIGMWGISRTPLGAFQQASGSAATVDTLVRDATASDPSRGEDSAVELSGLTKPMAGTEPATNPAAKPRRVKTGGAAEFSRQSARAAEHRLNELMQSEPVADLSFPGEISLTAVLEFITEIHKPSVVIKLNTRALEDEGFSDLDVIMVRDLDIDAGLMTVGSALDYILSQTSGPELTWIAKDELLLITTESSAESEENMFLRSYDISRTREISQLTAAVQDFNPAQGGMGGGGANFSLSDEPSKLGRSIDGGGPPAVPRKKRTEPSRPLAQDSEAEDKSPDAVIRWEAGLLQTIQNLTSPPCAWQETNGGGGTMSIAGNRLIVRQSRRGHEQVVAVLEQLDMAAEDVIEEQARAIPQ